MLMVGHRILQARTKGISPGAQRALKALGWAVTFGLANAAWILFRAPTIGQAGRMLFGMFAMRGLKPSYSVNDYFAVLFALAAYFIVEPLVNRARSRDGAMVLQEGARFWLRPLAYGVSAMLLFMFDRSNVAFIYFQF
jgi:hypothetical protein